jgi:hypothetical protein
LTGNPIEHAVSVLESEHPNWMVWVAYRPVAVPTWCARRWDNTSAVLHAGTAERLAEAIERAEAEPSG